MVQTTNEYITLEAAAKRLGVPAYYLNQILDTYGITKSMRAKLSRSVTIRSADLRGLRRVIREEMQHQGAA